MPDPSVRSYLPASTKVVEHGVVLFACVILFLCSAAASRGAEGSSPKLVSQLCADELALPPEAECGRVAVFENRVTARGRELDLYVVSLPAVEAERQRKKPPLFFLAGGPGDAATLTAGPLASVLASLRVDRDLVFVDIRGTGRSAPLVCPPLGSPDRLQTYMKYLLDLDDVRGCLAELQQMADLTQYTTSYAADDLNDVRKALGYPKMALFGGSYGTRLAQEVMRRHPDRVELAVLLAVAPPGMFAPSGFARSQQTALDRLVELCSEDPECRHSYPHFSDQLAQIVDHASAEPATATISHPAFDRPQEVRLGRGELVMGLRFLAYQADLAARFPQLIAAAAEGDYGPILSSISLAYHDIHQNFFFGLYYSMTCAEDLPFVNVPAEIESSKGTLLGMYRMQRQLDTCQLWPNGKADPHLHEPLATDIPVLLISGELDPVTPVANGDLVARTLSRSLHMVLAHRGHGPLDPDALACWIPAFERFARASSLDGLDISCASELEPMPFAFASE